MQRAGYVAAFVAVLFALCAACATRPTIPAVNANTAALPTPHHAKTQLTATNWIWPFESLEAPEPEGELGPALACDPHYRWPIKTLADSDAVNVSLTPQETTIADLRAYPKPSPFPLPSEYPTRIAPFEYTTWELVGVTLYEIYPPGSDQDYHVILEDSSGNPMITESVNVGCAPGTIVGTQITTVRSFIDAHWSFGSPPAPVFPNTTVTVTGVGFYDPWTGDVHPASGAELHPLLSIMLGTPGPSASPSPSPSASPSPSPSPSPTPSPSPSPSPSRSPSPTAVAYVADVYSAPQ